MLNRFANMSVRNKLILISISVTGIAILLALVISTLKDVRNAREMTQRQLVVLADVIASNSASAIIFNDAEAAKVTLEALSANEIIVHAEIKNQLRQIFATYERKRDESASWMQSYPSLSREVVERPINISGEPIGTLIVTADLSAVWHALGIQWLLNFMVLAIIFFISYLVLRHASNYVLDPIGRLAEAAREIINRGDYSLRVEKTTRDELGELTDEFNLMLAQIEDRDNQLQQSNEALAQAQEPILLRDINLRCQYINPAFSALFGYTLEELKGKPFSLRPDNPVEAELSQEDVYDIAKNEGVYRGETYRQTKGGKVVPVLRHISPVKDKAGNVKGYVSVISDITEKKQAEELIWRQANYDSLTGLPNRHLFSDRLKLEIKKIKRVKLPLALMFLDLDHFKEINDTLGHDMGDELLKEAAKRIVSCLRESDIAAHRDNVARLGGDEFTIVLSELSEAGIAELVAQEILHKLAEPFLLGKESAHISASIGIVTTYPGDSINSDTLIKYADIAMYAAKQQGRNRFSYFSQSMLAATETRMRLTNDMRRALEDSEFYLVYQPIVDLETDEIIKAEALIRWQHPTEGLVSPVNFISVAEDTGLIVEIGNWVFREAAHQVARWRKTLHKDFQVSVNKSPVQLHSVDREGASWFDYLDELGLPGESVIVEITEGVFLNKNAMVVDKLLEFRDAGMQVSLDDFGTGYSSLSYLKKFDIDYIKIDQSFVQNLEANSDDMALCEAIIVMAHKLDIKVVAEGVETQQQLDLLKAAGCDYGQGYLFSKPTSAKNFERICKTRNGARKGLYAVN